MSLEILTQQQYFAAPITAVDVFVERLESLSAVIKVIDITTYEVSGFLVDGDLNITGNVYLTDAAGILTAQNITVTNLNNSNITSTTGYFTTLSADTLGKALNLNNHSLTNANIDSGYIDNTQIGIFTPVQSRFTTLSADTLGKALNLNNHSLTNANIDSGYIDDTQIGIFTAVQSRFTTLSADTLGKALNLNSHALTNANIDSGYIDNTQIGIFTAVQSRFTTLSADTLGKALNLNSHALTNAKIDSGTINNTIIGGLTPTVGTFTTLTATQSFTVTGPISSSGNLITGNIPSSNTANTVFAAPNGSAGAASFRALVANDIPVLDTAKITTGTFAVNRGGTGQNTFTVGNVLLGNGTNGLNSVAGLTTTLSALSSDNTPMTLVFTNGVLTSVTV